MTAIDPPAHRAHLVARARLLLQRHIARHWHRVVRDENHPAHLLVGLDTLRSALLAEAVEPPLPLPEPDALTAVIQANRSAEVEMRTARGLPAAVLDRLGLDPVSIELLQVGAILQSTPELGAVLGPVTGAGARPQPTAGMLIEICADDAPHRAALERALGPDWPLRRLRLIALGHDRRWSPRPPPLMRPILVAASVERLIAGHPPFDDIWPLGAVTVEVEGPPPEVLVVDDRARLDGILGDLAAGRELTPVILVGPPGSGRRTATRAHALAVGRVLMRVELDALPVDTAGFETALGAILRDVRLAGGVALIRGEGFDRRGDARLPIVARLVTTMRPAAVISARPEDASAIVTALPDARVATMRVADAGTRRTLYARLLVQNAFEMSRRQLTELVDTYDLQPGDLHHALRDVRRVADGSALERGAFDAAVRRRVRSRLADLATALGTSGQTWDDLVVDAALRGTLDEIIAHARHRTEVFEEWGFAGKVGGRGRGLSCLFSGPPGTGKTMTATLIGQTLGLDVFQVDLSRVVDKYVGETEKNLARLFDEASRAPVVLLFDEADSLFATRTEVQSSNDRYANLEINYLLQRMERFSGISILTTNRETAIDPAFKRRLRFRLHFDAPDEAQRVRLWRSMVPAGCQIAAEIDWQALASRWEMTGALIRNAMLRAAFLAAARGTIIDEASIREAARSELIEMGRLGN